VHVSVRALPALVFVVVLAAFLPAVGGAFLNWDDAENLVANPHYRGLGLAELRWMWSAVHMGHYIPVTWLTFGLDYLLWGMNATGYHLTSVLIHAWNAALVYLVAARLLEAGASGLAPPQVLRTGAALGAPVWALHPLRVESVAWLTERRDVVSGGFALLAVLAYLTAARRTDASGRLHRGYYGLAVGAFALAVFAKSIVVGLPLVLIALDVFPLRRLRGGWRRVLRVAVLEKLPFLAIGALAAAIMLMIGFRWGLLAPIAAESIPQRLALTGYSLAFYLGKTVWPWPLSPLYSLYRPVDPLALRYLVPGCVTLALTLGLIALRRRWPGALCAWVAYVALLLPAAGILPNGPQIAADRYTYLPSVGWGILAGTALPWAWRARQAGRLSPRVAGAALLAALGLVAGLAVLTERQIGIWRDSVALWRHAAWADPDSDVPLFYLGWALADAGRFDEARAHFEASRRRVPESLPLLRAQFTLHLALLEPRAGRAREAEARLRETLTLDPDHPVAWTRLGTARWTRGDTAGAEEAWTAAADRAPFWARYQVWELRAAVAEVPESSRVARARLAFALAAALQEYRAHAEAEEHYRLAVRLEPGFAAAWNNLGVTYASRGRYADALDAFIHALRLDPGERGACANARRAAAVLGTRPQEMDACGPERG
jgi:protein O-mannosyl-transferase